MLWWLIVAVAMASELLLAVLEGLRGEGLVGSVYPAENPWSILFERGAFKVHVSVCSVLRSSDDDRVLVSGVGLDSFWHLSDPKIFEVVAAEVRLRFERADRWSYGEYGLGFKCAIVQRYAPYDRPELRVGPEWYQHRWWFRVPVCAYVHGEELLVLHNSSWCVFVFG